MEESLGSIVGYVDTFSSDAANQSMSFSGWAVDEAHPSNDLEFRVSVDGLEHAVDVRRYARPDIGHFSALNVGFTITCAGVSQTRLTAPDVIRVYASIADYAAPRCLLKVGDVAIEQIHRWIWLSKIEGLSEGQVRNLVSELFPKIRAMLPASETGSGLVSPDSGLQKTACTKVYLPYGFTSFDGSCILGGMGHAFLVGGSNNVLENYQVPSDSPRVTDLGNRWIDLFKQRQVESHRRGIQYLQTVIPEKMSLMPELVPYDISGPTKLLFFIENWANRSFAPYVSGYETLAEDRKFETFDTIDTHLSPFGAFRIFKKVMESLGVHDEIYPIFRKSESMRVGDVAERFIVNSTLLHPDTELLKIPLPLNEEGMRIVEEFDPSSHGHIGVRRVFANPLAPVKKKLLVFGNSFFERGGHPKTLTWWFARTFTEFHFIWDPAFDWDYADRISPDIIIGQTIERFLSRVPKS